MVQPTNPPVIEREPFIPTLRLIPSSNASRKLARAIGAFLLVMPVVLYFVPWQQNISGYGRVVAFDPLERQQTLEAPIDGRILKVYVTENAYVRKGDRLLDIADIDPELPARLNRQRDAILADLRAARSKEENLRANIDTLIEAQKLAVFSSEQYLAMATQKVKSARQELAGAEAAFHQAELDYNRQKALARDELIARKTLELAELKYRETKAKVEKAQADLSGAENDRRAKEADIEKIRAEAQVKIDSAKAYRDEAQQSIAKTSKEMAEIENKVARQLTQQLVAPRDGRILRVLINEGAELVKSGRPLLVLVPETDNRAVELFVDGNDVTLIRDIENIDHDRRVKVRLQFEGWPAVQFAGWPSVGVGSYGGYVALVDATDNGKGKFRVVVLPDPEEQERNPWPAGNLLRQGVEARGWILLDQVRLGWEIWRVLNGFRPVIEPKAKENSAKPPKIKVG